MKTLFLLTLAIVLLLPESLLSAEVFRWKDAQGVVHMSDTPPENASNVTVMKIHEPEKQREPSSPPSLSEDEAADEIASELKPDEAGDAGSGSSARQDVDDATGDSKNDFDASCYTRYLHIKAHDGITIILNDGWVFKIARPSREQVAEKWMVGDRLEICDHQGTIVNVSRQGAPTVGAERVRHHRLESDDIN